ncbi:MAG: hypothetical protein AABX14_03640 [Candidatus Aenigmatarchaeota archaeon]
MSKGRSTLRRIGIPTLVVSGFLLPGYVAAGLESGYWSIPKQFAWHERYAKLYGEVQELVETDTQRCCDSYGIEAILKKRGIETTSPGINPTMEQLEKTYEILLREKNRQ